MINWTGNKPNHPAGHCQFCGYNLHSIQGEICPECGNSRMAWVETTCEECKKTCVYPIEESDRVEFCQFCGKTIDVPSGPPARRPLTASILRTRFSMVSFVLTVLFTSFFLLLPILFALILIWWLVVGGQPNPVLLIPAILAAVAAGVAIGRKTCYR